VKKYNYKYVNVGLSADEYNEFNKIVEEFGFNRSKIIKQLIRKFVHDYKTDKFFLTKKTNLTNN